MNVKISEKIIRKRGEKYREQKVATNFVISGEVSTCLFRRSQ